MICMLVNSCLGCSKLSLNLHSWHTDSNFLFCDMFVVKFKTKDEQDIKIKGLTLLFLSGVFSSGIWLFCFRGTILCPLNISIFHLTQITLFILKNYPIYIDKISME